jgi:hypothetical protein
MTTNPRQIAPYMLSVPAYSTYLQAASYPQVFLPLGKCRQVCHDHFLPKPYLLTINGHFHNSFDVA